MLLEVELARFWAVLLDYLQDLYPPHQPLVRIVLDV
jgi:hypothetical protein